MLGSILRIPLLLRAMCRPFSDDTCLLAGGDVLATAILDRFLRSHVLNLSGSSDRLHDLEHTAVSSSSVY